MCLKDNANIKGGYRYCPQWKTDARTQTCGVWKIIPEAASVVEPPISQVPLHEVNVFATDPTDAADGTACSSQSLQGSVRGC